MNIEKRVERLENRIKFIIENQVRINSKLNNIIHTRNHYLRHRAPAVMKKQKMMLRRLSRMVDKFDKIPRMNLKTSSKAKSGSRFNTLLLVTTNQAEKLKAIADSNLIGLLNGKNNKVNGKRVVLGYRNKKAKSLSENIKSGIKEATK